ncbi:hypothetical protein [Sulfobacillus thermosulfidooxidans]|uniref:hypothetical protein n=1 Tax=Sulfobacillus thermosulfidooxidans TaxID=28034 RepID=UPI0014943EFB|nr:hypothetical protein [Sulfobacillus thermosulfidooxidans]
MMPPASNPLAWDVPAMRQTLRRVVSALQDVGWPNPPRLRAWGLRLGQGSPSSQWDGPTLHRAIVLWGTITRTLSRMSPVHRDAWWDTWGDGPWDDAWVTQALADWLGHLDATRSAGPPGS